MPAIYQDRKLSDTLDVFKLVTDTNLNGQEFRYIFVPSLPAIIRGITITALDQIAAGEFEVSVNAKDQDGVERWIYDEYASSGIYASGPKELYFGPGEYLFITTTGLDLSTTVATKGATIMVLGELNRKIM